MASSITTHVLDTSIGRPAAGVPVVLERKAEEGWEELARGTTDEDGRAANMTAGDLPEGVYRLTFDTAVYFAGRDCFYPVVTIEFNYRLDAHHHHVPLLISPFGYSTYRGS